MSIGTVCRENSEGWRRGINLAAIYVGYICVFICRGVECHRLVNERARDGITTRV